MRIVLDLGAAQTENAAARRDVLSRAKSMLRLGAAHEFWIVLDAAHARAAEHIRQAFDGLLPQPHIRLFHPPATAAGAWGQQVQALMSDTFIADLDPDLVHVLGQDAGDAPIGSHVRRFKLQA